MDMINFENYMQILRKYLQLSYFDINDYTEKNCYCLAKKMYIINN